MTTIRHPGEDNIDRITPTLLPSGRSLMRQRWAHLLFLHWPLPVESLRPLIPDTLDVDTFEGQAFVGLVPFTMTGVRPVWAPPVWGLSSFHEVNVRTYVHQQGRDPGVWFFSLDAANRIAVFLARRFWHLPYYFARMSLSISALESQPGSFEIDYRSERLGPVERPATCHVTYRPIGSPAPAKVGTLEHFLAERYFLYTRHGARLVRGQVHHAPYPLQPAKVVHLEESLLAASGIARPAIPPLAHYASEVRVRIYPLTRVETSIASPTPVSGSHRR